MIHVSNLFLPFSDISSWLFKLGFSMQNGIDSLSISPIASFPLENKGQDRTIPTLMATRCHGVLYCVTLIVPSILFVGYLLVHAKKNLRKLFDRTSHVMISYYALLWFATAVNLAWCCLQVLQCIPGKELAWNLLSLFTSFGLLYLEISVMAFLLQESFSSGLEALARIFILSGVVVSVDMLLKAIYVFGIGVPLFFDGIESTDRMKWGLWIFRKLMLTAVYGFILFVRFTKWRDKLLPRPAFYNYIVIMFVTNAAALFGCGVAAAKAGFGIWLYDLTVICYHSIYLPFLFITFLADFFQEEDLRLDNAYYSEMKDAGFLDADLE